MKVYTVIIVNEGEPEEIVDIVSVHKSIASARKKVIAIEKAKENGEDLEKFGIYQDDFDTVTYVAHKVE